MHLVKENEAWGYATQCWWNRSRVKYQSFIFLALISWMCGCSSLGTYFEDRALDLTDVIDPKYGLAFPACAKVEVTDYLSYIPHIPGQLS